MLGVVENPCEARSSRSGARPPPTWGCPRAFRKAPVGVFFGEPGVEVEDPYFGGAGPRRTGCVECGNCMVGCRHGAKNTLRKNYLHLAEALGVVIEPMRTVTRLGVVPGSDGADPAYGNGGAVHRVLHERTGPVRGRDARVITARHVVVAGGTWGTQSLLHAMRDEGEPAADLGAPRPPHAHQQRGVARRDDAAPTARGRTRRGSRHHGVVPPGRAHARRERALRAGLQRDGAAHDPHGARRDEVAAPGAVPHRAWLASHRRCSGSSR